MLTLAGVNDENLIELMRQTGVRVALRGDTMTLSGRATRWTARSRSRSG